MVLNIHLKEFIMLWILFRTSSNRAFIILLTRSTSSEDRSGQGNLAYPSSQYQAWARAGWAGQSLGMTGPARDIPLKRSKNTGPIKIEIG